MKKIYGVFATLAVLTACASDPSMDDWSAEEIYNKAYDDLEATKYKKAAEEFEKVETEHPYSKWAVKSKLMSAFAYYKDEKYDDAIMAADRFLKYHPGNKDAAYALYLKGICYYDQISAADKDQGDTQKAEEAFQYLITLFPNTPYAEDARNKINLTEDYKAGQEMVIGRFYLNEGNYLSALNRFNVVLEEYQTTIQIEEALYREVEIYAILGMNQYANGYYKILLENYPQGRWTAKAAKIMERIGVENKISQTQAKVDEPVKESWYSRWKEQKGNDPQVVGESDLVVEPENKSWFSGWFGGNEESAEVAEAPKVEAPVAPADEGKSWFSGWFGGDEEVAEVAEAPKAEAPADEGKSWFSGWFGGNEEAAEVAEAPKAEAPADEGKSWFSGWFGGNEEVAEVAEAPKAEAPADEGKSWFSGWFGGDEELAEVAEAPKAEAPVAPADEGKSWFSGWFGGNEEVAEVAEAPKAEAPVATVIEEENRIVLPQKEESKSWFSSWFGSESAQ